MPEPLMKLVEDWRKYQEANRGVHGGGSTSASYAYRVCATELEAALKAWAAAIPNNADGLYADNELTEFYFFHKDILGVRDE